MDEKKPSTADILAKIRAQKAAAAAPAPAAEAPPVATPEPPAAAAPAAAAPVAEAAPAPAVPKPAAPAAKPGSTKDILAAIRANKGGAKTAEAAPVAAAATAAPAAAVAAAPAAAKPAVAASGPLPSVAEMVKAAREGAPAAASVAAAEAKAKPVAPPMPQKPLPAASSKKAPDPVRRGALMVTLLALAYVVSTPFRMAWTAVTVVTGIATLGTARFMFPNVLVEPPSKFKVGPASDYPLNAVSNKWKDQFGIWIVHTDQYEGKNLIFALQSVCTHLGCTPNWLDGEQKFKCPCHGSGFYITGVNFEGPAPRPLERMGLRIAEDGMLEVDKSVKFQEEMGQWLDPASAVEVV
jgi:cytochrome b6-f complex iron-sulfur subunit